MSFKILFKDFNSVQIFNNLGQAIKEEEIQFKEKSVSIKTNDLPNGVYSLLLKSGTSTGSVTGTVSKRFVINR